MNTLSSKLPRARALVGTLAATAALAGIAQGVIPAFASAQKSLQAENCTVIYSEMQYWQRAEISDMAHLYEQFFNEEHCGNIPGPWER